VGLILCYAAAEMKVGLADSVVLDMGCDASSAGCVCHACQDGSVSVTAVENVTRPTVAVIATASSGSHGGRASFVVVDLRDVSDVGYLDT